MIFTTPEDKREQEKSKEKSLNRIKWKLKTKSIFNLKSFGTVAILKSTEIKDKPGQQSSDYVHVQSITIWIKLQVQLAAV